MDKYFSYMLGFIWADGFLYENVSRYTHSTSISIAKEDMDEICDYLKEGFKFGGDYTRKRKENWKEIRTLSTNDIDLFNFLKENDYKDKSINPPNKILSLVPGDLKKYWFRGFFDGDGCIYISGKPNYNNQICFSSSYEYDWSFLVDLLKSIGIDRIEIRNRISKKGNKSSSLRITNKKSIKIFGDYLYGEDDSICLKRKRDKIYTISKEVKS